VKAVIDTNIFVSGIFWGGIPHKILEAWISDKFELLVSDFILEEYFQTLKNLSSGKRDDLVDKWYMLISENATIIESKKRLHLCRDPKDDKFLDCAVSGNAQYIVSGDKDLLVLGNVFSTQIIKASPFHKLLCLS
jgi:putative PIN family toxin of toxin-antitoxin system